MGPWRGVRAKALEVIRVKLKGGGLWLVVYMTHSRQRAETVERLLSEEGFLVRAAELNRAVFGSGTFEISVLESEAQEARKLLLENGF